MRDKCACRRRSALTCGSLNLTLFSLFGTRVAIYKKFNGNQIIDEEIFFKPVREYSLPDDEWVYIHIQLHWPQYQVNL